ncbi:TatD DNase family Scn1 [Obba rivulosa]|uniref:TatD DNase family Scn1 n=1 Tax=Obba rivulosa TaxID=1052685 RepID=A0A8E2DK05_9APHY|nr:TatD DNase family Scn1 [Obba rivulosa]
MGSRSDLPGAATASTSSPRPPGHPSVLAHLVDVHCHPTDSPIPPDALAALPHRICAMASRQSDQALVRALATAHPATVVPCFGYHPWFAHWIALAPAPSKEAHYRALFPSPAPGAAAKPQQEDAFRRLLACLPEPILLSDVLADLRANLGAFPQAMLGEVGLDRACRIPFAPPAPPPYAEADGARELSPFTIPLEHQVAVLEAQLALAAELKRNVSMHSVKCQQATVELLQRMKVKHGESWLRISVDMHSCGLSAQTWADIERQHSNVFLSLSTVINARSTAHKALIATCSPNRILVESDFNDIRLSGPYTWDMLLTVAEVKGWRVEEVWDEGTAGNDAAQWGAVRRLEENWNAFVRGNHEPVKKKRDRKRLVLDESESEED